MVVEGHEGKMVFGYMRGGGGEKVPVVLLVGRAQWVIRFCEERVVQSVLTR